MYIEEKILSLGNKQYSKAQLHFLAEKMLVDLLHEVVFNHEYDRDIISLDHDMYGKPFVKVDGVHHKTSVSISHSGSYIYVAASSEDISLGVDVERIRTFSETLLKGMLSKKERELLDAHGHLHDSVYHTKIWCMKESILKAFGTGLRSHPQSIDVSSLLFLKEGECGVLYRDGLPAQCRIFCSKESEGHFFYGLCILDGEVHDHVEN
jgi:phosphopantetheinyl transferase